MPLLPIGGNSHKARLKYANKLVGSGLNSKFKSSIENSIRTRSFIVTDSPANLHNLLFGCHRCGKNVQRLFIFFALLFTRGEDNHHYIKKKMRAGNLWCLLSYQPCTLFCRGFRAKFLGTFSLVDLVAWLIFDLEGNCLMVAMSIVLIVEPDHSSRQCGTHIYQIDYLAGACSSKSGYLSGVC